MLEPQFVLFNPSDIKTTLEHLFIIVFAFASITAFWAAYHEPYQRNELIFKGILFGVAGIGTAIFMFLTT